VPLFRWSNNATKDLLAEYLIGLVGDWTLPKFIGGAITSSKSPPNGGRRKQTPQAAFTTSGSRPRDNHLLDCELMIVVEAVVTKPITAREISTKVTRK